MAGGWGDELRERSRATDRVLAEIHSGKLEPQEIIVRMIEKQQAALPPAQAQMSGLLDAYVGAVETHGPSRRRG